MTLKKIWLWLEMVGELQCSIPHLVELRLVIVVVNGKHQKNTVINIQEIKKNVMFLICWGVHSV